MMKLFRCNRLILRGCKDVTCDETTQRAAWSARRINDYGKDETGCDNQVVEGAALDVKMTCVMKRFSVPPDEHENQQSWLR